MYRTLIIVASAALLIGCSQERTQQSQPEPSPEDLVKLSSLSVSVIGITAPDPVQFEGHCIYTAMGREMRKELNGKGNLNRAFRGDTVKHCEVRKISGGGWIQLIVSADGKNIFESPKMESNDVIEYDAKQK